MRPPAKRSGSATTPRRFLAGPLALHCRPALARTDRLYPSAAWECAPLPRSPAIECWRLYPERCGGIRIETSGDALHERCDAILLSGTSEFALTAPLAIQAVSSVTQFTHADVCGGVTVFRRDL